MHIIMSHIRTHLNSGHLHKQDTLITSALNTRFVFITPKMRTPCYSGDFNLAQLCLASSDIDDDFQTHKKQDGSG